MSTNHSNKTPNALIHEKSPYLLQHAYNPVHWLPWSDAVFAKAAAEEKPIFLSIGYSTCHWWRVRKIPLQRKHLYIMKNRVFKPLDHWYN